MDRERGTATQPCPTCGTDLAVVELLDGATSTVLCGTCYPSAPTEKAVAAVAREYGKKEEPEPEPEEGEDD